MTDCTCRATINRCMVRGTSDIFTVTLSNEGVPIDITDWTVRYTVRKVIPANDVVDDTNAEISAIAVLTDPTNGVCVFNIPPEDTRLPIGTYYYDIKTEDTNDVEYIPVGGSLDVVYSITQD